jgi:hypothetical protein
MNVQTIVSVFLISSVVSVITLAYLNIAAARKKVKVPFMEFIPFTYGIVGLINLFVITSFGSNYSIFVGMLFGLALSTIGRFKLNLPTKLFNFTKQTEYQVHIYAMVLYAAIFHFIITPSTEYIIGN